MANPPNYYPPSGSFDDLVRRMTRRLKEKNVDKQIYAILMQVFEQELGTERIILARPDRVRMFQQVSKAVLADVLGKISDAK